MGRGGEHPVADGLIRLSGMTQSVFARTAERHGLPAAQARLLCMLAAGPRRMSELAGLLGVERAALTGLGDRRAVSVALTPEGREVAEGFHRDISEELERLTDVLPPDERERFRRSLA